MMLPNDELAEIRAAIADLLPDTCYILSPVSIRAANGEVTQTWGTATAATPCRFDPLKGTEQDGAGGVKIYHGYRVTMTYDTTITSAQRLLFGGVTYNIISVDPGKSWLSSLRLDVERV